jgi:hypothetical protein
MKMGGMGYKESSGLTPWASRARRAESSFGTPSPLHESLQFPVAEASEAANRNVGFTSIAAGGFAQTPAIAQPRAEWVNSTEAVSKLRKIFRPAARSEDFHNFFVSGRSQGSKKRTK